jgi:hypothetical protein
MVLPLLLSGCGGGTDRASFSGDPPTTDDSPPVAEGVVEHPVEERIPHSDQDAISIDKETSFEALSDPPRSLRVLRRFLAAPASVDTTHLGLFVKMASTVRAASIGTNRLVLLDGNPGNRLFEYDRRADALTQIAAPGGGPGELKFAMDLMRDGRSVYVARQDRRIDRFLCATDPCTYEATTRLEVSTTSIADGAEGLAVLAQPSTRRQGRSTDELGGAIHPVAPDGAVREAFGTMYHTSVFLVRTAYGRGSLAYGAQREEYILASEKLPYLWTYGETGDLTSVFRVSEFRPLQIEYDPADRSRHKRFEEHYSTLRMLGPLDGRFAVPLVRHHTLGSEGVRVQRVDYYAVDLTTREAYFLGTDVLGEEIVERTVLVTDAHQVLIENGAVALIESK